MDDNPPRNIQVHATLPDSGSDNDPVIRDRLSALRELEGPKMAQEQYVPSFNSCYVIGLTILCAGEKRVQLESNIKQAKNDLEQARMLLSGLGEAPAHGPELTNSHHSPTLVNEDLRPSSPLTPSPSTESGSPRLTDLQLPSHPVADTSTMAAGLLDDRSISVEPPRNCLVGMTVTAAEQDGGEQAPNHLLETSGDHQGSVPSRLLDPIISKQLTIVERVGQMSHGIRTLNDRFNETDRTKSLSAEEPYRSELARAFGTPPKVPQNWADQWSNYYIASQGHFDGHFPHANNVGSEPAPPSKMGNEFNIQPIHFGDTVMNMSVTLDNSNPNLSDSGISMMQGVINEGSSVHRDPGTLPAVYSFKEEAVPNYQDINMSVEYSKHELPVVAVNNDAHMPDLPIDQPNIPVFAPAERDLKLSAVKVEQIVAQVLSLGKGSQADERAKRTRTTRVTNLTGRHIPVDMSKIGYEQFKINNFNWATYDTDQRDMEAYLGVLENSRYKHIATVANQDPSGFSKDDIFRLPEQGLPFDSLPDLDKAMLRARGRVAILHFVEETAKVEDLLSKIRHDDKVSKPPAPRLVPNWVKKLALSNATYLPEAATTSIKVSLEFLTNSDRRLVCRYHQSDRNNRPAPRDGAILHRTHVDPGTRELYGIAHPRAATDDDRKPGHAHCGCSLNNLLLDWFLYKTRGATSTNDNPEFDMLGKTFFQHSSMSPIPRAYYLTLFTSLTGFDGTSDGLYVGADGWGQEPGDWKTPEYEYKFNIGVLDHTFKAMGVNPWVLYRSKPTDD